MIAYSHHLNARCGYSGSVWVSPSAHLSSWRRSYWGGIRSRSGAPGLEDRNSMSGGRPGGCQGSAGGGGALSEILAERLGKGWSGRVLSVDTLRGELGCKPCSVNGFAGIQGTECWSHLSGGSLHFLLKDWSGMTSRWKGIRRFSSHSIAGYAGLEGGL